MDERKRTGGSLTQAQLDRSEKEGYLCCPPCSPRRRWQPLGRPWRQRRP
ncbi:hypothetical protein P4H70_00250 [Paenibacillus ehimensis]|nr:hypothetical protein [Paenibacillus ehimensis]MEC0207366.1 hypothetical protein [Paenibacillus ehimensis]